MGSSFGGDYGRATVAFSLSMLERMKTEPPLFLGVF